jgi:uncharacterized repeat protein (TIGR01451 family)
MRISRLLFTTTLLALLGSFSSGAQAADSAIRITSIAQTEVEAVGKDGKKTLKRTPVTKAVPGTEVIYTNTFENVGNKPAGDIVINNPIPNDSEYKTGSAFGKNCEILFSVDGGKKFGHADELKVKDADGKEVRYKREATMSNWTFVIGLDGRVIYKEMNADPTNDPRKVYEMLYLQANAKRK